MMESISFALIQNFGIALLLGLIVGLEGEFHRQKQGAIDFGGVRTFSLISLFGWICGYLALELHGYILLLGMAGMILITIACYSAVVWRTKGIGATTEFSAIIVFMLGMMVALHFVLIAVISAVLMATVLSYKGHLHKFAKKLQLDEVHGALKFAIISLVLLPLLPNTAYAPTDIAVLRDVLALLPTHVYDVLAATQAFNPFKIWLMVVLICAISFIGYIAIKLIGAKKGIGLTGAIGGLVSSTAVTSSLSLSSKKSKVVNAFVFGVIIAWTIMFFRVLLVTSILNKEVFFASFISIGLMAVVSAMCAAYLYMHRSSKGKKTAKAVAFKSPFALGPALKFGGFFGLVLFGAKLLQGLFGSSGIYIASVLSGLADVDAITISMATLASSGEVSVNVAVTAITLAVASNTVVKAGIAYMFGGKEFAQKVLVCTGIVLSVGLLAIVFL
jgi:uncharacterized membrane protein (DUF4010 family)